MTLLPLEHLRRYYDGLVADVPGARKHALDLWSDDCILRFPGNNPFSGAHAGKKWHAQEYLPALATRGTVHQKEAYTELVGDDTFGLSHYNERFTLPEAGQTLVARRFALYEFEDDLIVSIRIFEEDQAAVDDFFNTYFR